MAQTVTVLMNAVAVGGTGSQGSNATKTTLQAASTVVGLNAQLTNGAGVMPNLSEPVKVYILVSSVSVTAAEAMAQGGHSAKCLEIRSDERPSGIRLETSELIPAVGGYVYTWVEEPKMPVAGTLTLNLVEF